MLPRGMALLAVGLVACQDPSDPDKMRVVGLIDPARTSPPVIDAPEEAARNQRFLVTVYTVGSSDCTHPDGEDVAVVGDLVRIVPYDIVPRPGHTDVCRDDNAARPHPLALVLPRAGTVTLRVVGRRPAGPESLPDSVERVLRVLP